LSRAKKLVSVFVSFFNSCYWKAIPSNYR